MAHRETIRFHAPLRAAQFGAFPLVPAVAPSAVPAPPPVDVEALTRAAYERGRLEGEQSVSEQLVRQRVEFSELQNGLLAALRETLPQVARASEALMIEIALEAAQRLVAGQPISATLVEAVVREALAQAQEAAEIEVQLNAEDLELLRHADSPLLAPADGAQKLHLTAALNIARGGCLVVTRFGTGDARRETKLANLRETLAA